MNFDGRQVELPAGLFQIEEDLAGDPALGHVLFVRDFHAPPGFSEMTPRAQGPVWRYQWSLLGLFERLRPRHIFVEELARSGGTQLVLERLAEAGPIEASLPNIQELRSVASAFETRPSPALSYFAGAVGADSLHALRYVNEVTLHRTLSPEEALQSQRGLQNSTDCLRDAGVENCSQVFEENSLRDREAWASREVIQYLRQNPGASVVLVFGGRHQFCDNFVRENFRPRMTTLEVKMDALGYSRLAPPTARHCR